MYTLNNAVTGQHYAQGISMTDLAKAAEYARILSLSLIHPIAIRMDGGNTVATATRGLVETVEAAVATAIQSEVEAELEDAWATMHVTAPAPEPEPEPEPAAVEVAWEEPTPPAKPKPPVKARAPKKKAPAYGARKVLSKGVKKPAPVELGDPK